MIEMDITNIKYPDETFDLIICSHVLEHIIDDRKAISEFKRVIKKTGVVILMVPLIREKTEEDFLINTPEGRLKAYGQGDHVRACGKDYVDRIRSSGFDVEVVNQEILKPDIIKKYHLVNDEVFLCTK
jgi:SAM-dependent methyltransferase